MCQLYQVKKRANPAQISASIFHSMWDSHWEKKKIQKIFLISCVFFRWPGVRAFRHSQWPRNAWNRRMSRYHPEPTLAGDQKCCCCRRALARNEAVRSTTRKGWPGLNCSHKPLTPSSCGFRLENPLPQENHLFVSLSSKIKDELKYFCNDCLSRWNCQRARWGWNTCPVSSSAGLPLSSRSTTTTIVAIINIIFII